MTRTYNTINEKPWSQILLENKFQWQPPFTVHLPIQPVHSPDFIHVDCGLNVCRRRIYPNDDISNRDLRVGQRETMLVQFAFDNPPLIPDFNCSKMTLAEGRYPVVQTDYFIRDILYRFEYFCCSVEDSKQSMLWIRCITTNEGRTPQEVTVRVKINLQKEEDLFHFHYVPFYWDSSRWLTCSKISMQGDRIRREEQVIGKLLSGKFSRSWEEAAVFKDSDYNSGFDGNNPYFVTPPLRYKNVQDVICLKLKLEPGRSEDFALALLTNYENITDSNLNVLAAATAEPCRERALTHFKSSFGDQITRLNCPAEEWERIFTAMQTSTLQLLVRFPDTSGLMPTQGGSSERFFVWVWEAVCMLMPLLQVGHFKVVRDALDFIFGLQDAGCPPKGRFTTTAGSIGTTGPRWICTTGAALSLATDYYLYAHDEAFLDEYLPKIIRAADWIVGEIKDTRRLNPDGTRPLTYGLMPFGCATDGDIGHVVAFTDAYTFWGLDKVVRLLENLKYERMAEYRRELEQYQTDITMAIAGLARADGFIARKIPTGSSEESFTDKFENPSGAVHLGYCKAIDVESETFRKYVGYFESNRADGYFTGRMDRAVCYMGLSEWLWQDVYLRLGEWKKAFMAVQTNLKYGMTQDTFQVQERFSKNNPAFTPWQPNGSGSGRMLDMILKSFYFEYDKNEAILLGGIPFVWLKTNGLTTVDNLYTIRGKINLEVAVIDDRRCRVRVYCGDSGVLPSRVRFPEYLTADSDSENAKNCGGGYFEITPGVKEVSFTISEERL